MDSSIAEKLIALRVQRGLSQAELAAKLGKEPQIIAGWENRDISPDTDSMIAIARFYNISLDKLFNLDVSDSEQRSAISLDKGRTSASSQSGPEMRIRYPEKSAGSEVYPGTAPSEQPASQSAQTVYAEPENLAGYFNYETADGTALPANAQVNKPAVDFSSEIYETINRIQKDKKFYKKLMKFPYPVFATTAFLATGGLFNWWHPMWMIFLTIPLYYTTIEAIYKKNANIFCYPVLVTLLYLIAGFALNLWHPGWLAFLSIPFYYWIVNTYGKDDEDEQDEKPKKKKRKGK